MMNSKRNQGRTGRRGCYCCEPRLSTRTIRTREKRKWKNDY